MKQSTFIAVILICSLMLFIPDHDDNPIGCGNKPSREKIEKIITTPMMK